MKKILALNIEPELTQIGVYFNEEAIIFDQVKHFPEELLVFKNNAEQLSFRLEIIRKLFKKYNLSLHDFSGICGWGGSLFEREGGIYRITANLVADAKRNVEKDISSLLVEILFQLEEEYQVESYIIEHCWVDELPVLARYSGSPSHFRWPFFDALLIRTAGMMWAEQNNKDFDNLNLIISSLTNRRVETVAFLKGRVVDLTSSIGDGAFSLLEPGRLSAYLLDKVESISQCQELSRSSGLVSYLKDNVELGEIEQVLESQDELKRYSSQAFLYNIAKDIGALMVNFAGKPDGIIFIGISTYPLLKEELANLLSYAGEIHFFQNFSKIRALAYRMYRCVSGKEKLKEYV